MTGRPIRQKLLAGTATLATILVAQLATPGQAALDPNRVFQATPTYDGTKIDYVPGATVDTINVLSPTAIINWTPLDPASNPIDFVPAGREGRFQGTSDFAVLNRVTGTAGHALQFNGSVTSSVNGNPGGTVMFYSADGFIIAPSGTFNVGSLVLTTGDITDPAFTGSSFKTGTPGVGATITNNGSITASNYIVLASPKIVQNGSVHAQTAAYVAAGATSFTFSNGLFDILVDNAIDDAQVTHTAAASTVLTAVPGASSRAYFVAVPKNDAMALLLTGNIGYASAAEAETQGVAVVLSAGTSVKNITEFSRPGVLDSGKALVQLGNATINGTLDAMSTGDVTLQSTGNSLLTLSGGANITSLAGTAALLADDGDMNITGAVTVSSLAGATGIAKVSVTNGHSIELVGDLTVSARDDRASGDALGGNASVTVNDGTLLVGSQFKIDASASAVGNDAGNATGGTASINLTNALLNAGSLTMRADASAANAPDAGGVAGAGQAGTVNFETHPTTNITLDSITMTADGRGGSGTPNDFSASPLQGDASGKGGAGTGGTITISLDSGAGATFGLGGLSASVVGSGGNGRGNCNFCTDFFGNDAGDGIGGTIGFSLASGSAGNNTTILTLDSGGLGGGGGVGFRSTTVDGGDAGDVTAGTSTVTVTGGTLSVASLALSSKAVAGFAGDSLDHTDIVNPSNPKVPGGVGGAGGVTTAGSATISVTGGQLISAGSLSVDASVNAGQSGYGDTLDAVGTNGIGGTASITASGTGLIQAPDVFASADGKGGAGAPGGEGQGGIATITADGGTITATNIGASSAGFGGLALRLIDQNGTGRGGTATVSVINGGTITANSLSSAAGGSGNGVAGSSDGDGNLLGGSAFGGDAHIVIDGAGSTLNITTNLSVDAASFGGFGKSEGGSVDNSAAVAELAVTGGGTLNYTGTDDIILRAAAFAGSTVDFHDPIQLDNSVGGNAIGGTAQLVVGGATLLVPDGVNVVLDASAVGGDGLGTGGAATGGAALLRVGPGGSFHTSGDVSLDSSGFGGGGGNGGDGTGGSSTLDAVAGTTQILGTLFLGSNGQGGFATSGGNGGIGTGNIARLSLGDGNPNVTIATLQIDSSATGGDADGGGDKGGAAQGGTASIDTISGLATITGAATVNAKATGGLGGTGVGGDATGGTASVRVVIGNTVHAAGDLTLDTSATGGAGVGGGKGTGGTATINAFGGTGNFDGKVTMRSIGQGGAGIGGGSGGAGIGNITIVDLGTAFPAEFTIGSLETDSSGIGGNADGGGLNGGTATGGTSSIGDTGTTNGSLTIAGTANLKASAIGGLGGTGTGGNALGGTAVIGVGALNSFNFKDDVTLEASALGGDGGALGAGSGTGGTAKLEAFAGTTPILGTLSLFANGEGGLGLAGGDGGAGFGGVTTIALGDATPSVTLGGLLTDSGARGGDADGGGRNGGTATGGTSSVGGPISVSPSGSVTITGNARMVAIANGGAGGTGFGGNALGGTTVVHTDALSTFHANANVTLDTTARGGAGGSLGAGSGTGGTAMIDALAGTTEIVGKLTMLSVGQGGINQVGGNGGAGIGNVTKFSLGNGNPTITLGSLETDSSGIGGDASGGGKDGGAATGGTTSIGHPVNAVTGVVKVAGATTMSANATGGLAGTGVGGGGTGGTVSLSTVGNTSVHFDGATTLNANGTRANGGAIVLTSDSTKPGPALRFASLNANATGPTGALQSFDVAAFDDRIVVTDNATINVGGNARFSTQDNGGFDVGGTLDLTAGGALTFTHFGAAEVAVLNADNAKFNVGSLDADDDSTLIATNTLEVDALGFPGTIKAKKLKAANVVLKASGDVNITQANGPVSAEGDNVTVATDGDLDVTHVSAKSAIKLTSVTGGVTAADVHAGTDNFHTGNVELQGKTFVTFNGSITSTNGYISGFAPTINVNGVLEAPSIFMNSAKLAIGPSAVIGKLGLTSQLSLSNNGTDPSTIGGAGGGPGYVISAADLNKMRAQHILFSMPSLGLAGTPDVTVESFTLDAPTIFGSGEGGLTIDPPGSIAVTGAVKITNANPATFLSFEATNSITVVTDSGSIKMVDAANRPGGKLTLVADNIVVASQSAINDLAGLTTTQQRDARLSTSDNPSDEGALVAGSMEALVNTSFYIQNSGTGSTTNLNNRRGFTVGAGGLKITNGPSPLEVIINGRMVKTATTFYLGDTLIPLIDFNTPVEGVLNYAPLSSVNGCVILNAPCVATSGIPIPPIKDVINLVANNDPPTGDQTGQGPIQAINLPLIQFASSTPYSFSPPIDEPVTGAGNQDLWTGGPRCGGAGQLACQ